MKASYRPLIATLMLTTLLLVAGCNKSTASKPQVVRVDFAYYNPVSLVLKEKHFLEDDLAKDGVQVEWTQSQGSNKALELLNSKKDHHDYMADHTAWGVRVVQEVASPRVKLLYDIYHMQIMEGDLIQTIRDNMQWIGHFHTGGVPGRHELNNQQEVQWDGVMRAIADLKFQDYVAHEFVPTGDPLTSLRQAVELCEV